MKSLILTLLLIPTICFADKPSLTNINASDLEKISKEFSANFTHTVGADAGTLGNIFGFEVGVLAGVTDSPEFKKLVKEVDSSKDIGYIPHANLIAQLTIPFGITGELALIPETDISDITISNYSAAVRWTFGDLVGLPFDLAVRGHFSSNEISYKDTLSGSVESTVSFETSTYGAQLLASFSALPVITPYGGVGFVSASTDAKVEGSGTIFDTTFTTSQTAKSDNSSFHLTAGLNVSLLILKMGLEYSNMFDTNKYSFKLAFGF